jgi:hypothetical protein
MVTQLNTSLARLEDGEGDPWPVRRPRPTTDKPHARAVARGRAGQRKASPSPVQALLPSAEDAQAIIDPKDAAESVGLRYVSDARPGIRRKKSGHGFTYLRPDSIRLADRQALQRIRSLAIPPSWTDVWICPFADGHIQAIGRDGRGRKQYRYHPRFREVRESTKYEHVVAFAEALPAIRSKVREHMALHGLSREKILASVVHLPHRNTGGIFTLAKHSSPPRLLSATGRVPAIPIIQWADAGLDE